MADLEQIEENNKLVMGWYGSCDNEPCSDFPLKTQDVYDVIESVYEISTDASKPRVFSSHLASENNSFVQSLESLECGHTYWFTLKSGVVNDLKSLTIDNLVVTGEQIADAGRVTDDCDSGGGGAIADILFVGVPVLTGNDLEFSFSVDTSDLEAACTSNIWKYRIKDSNGTVIKESNALSTSTIDITENVPGGGDYVVEIWGLTSTGLMITTLKTENITIPWPASDFAVVGNINVNYLEWQGPSNSDSVTFSDPQGWVDTISFKKSLGIQNENNWRYKINNGQWQDVSNLQDGTSLDISDVLHFQLKEDLLGANDHDDLNTLSRSWDSSVTVVYTEKNGNVRETLVSLVGSVTNRIIGISDWADINDTDFNARVNVSKTALTRWQYKLEKLNDSQTSYATPRILSDYSVIKSNNNHTLDLIAYISDESDVELGPGYYKIFVRGIHDTDDGIVVTPVLSDIAFCNWPRPDIRVNGEVDTGYLEYEGPSPQGLFEAYRAVGGLFSSSAYSFTIDDESFVHSISFNTDDDATASEWSYEINDGGLVSDLPKSTNPTDVSVNDKLDFVLNEGLKATDSPTIISSQHEDKTYTSQLNFNYVGKDTLHPDSPTHGTSEVKTITYTGNRSLTLTGTVFDRHPSITLNSPQYLSYANLIVLNWNTFIRNAERFDFKLTKSSGETLRDETEVDWPPAPGASVEYPSGNLTLNLNHLSSDYLDAGKNTFNFSLVAKATTDTGIAYESGWIQNQVSPEATASKTIPWPTTIFEVADTISDTYVWQGVQATPANNGISVSIQTGWVKKLELKNAVGSDVSDWEYSLDNGVSWSGMGGVDVVIGEGDDLLNDTFPGSGIRPHEAIKLRLKANLEVDDYGDATVDVVATDVQDEVHTESINLNGSVSWPTPTFNAIPSSTSKGYRETEGPSAFNVVRIYTQFIKTVRWKTSGDVSWEYDIYTTNNSEADIPINDTILPTWTDKPYQVGTPFSTINTSTFYVRLKEGLEVPNADDMDSTIESAQFNNTLTLTAVDVADNVITKTIQLNGTVTEYPNGCADYDLSFATTGGEVIYDQAGVTVSGFDADGHICVDNFGNTFGTKGITCEVRDSSNNVITTGQVVTNWSWGNGNNIVYKASDQQAYRATNFSFGQGNVILTPMNL